MKLARWFALAMPLVNACTTRADLGGGVAAETAELALPIEVLGSGSPDEPVIAAVQLPLRSAELSAVQVLHVECHRCGFYGPPEYEALAKPVTKVKASLRINGAATNQPWLDVTDSNVVVDPVAAAHGGINGALVTLGFDVAIDPATRARLVAAPANNPIEFRFNGTDGLSNGFRILDVQFRDGQGKTLSPVTKHWADIGLEKIAGQSSTDASARGALLWAARNTLQKSPLVPRTLRAACSDCHAADGRDLQYFNYSNDSIVQRSRFYGLSAEQGQDIAAFLRASLATSVPHVPKAAPWNPPYQPGPGLDAKPAVEWAAGAGLDSVWSDAASSVKALLGQPIDGTPLVVTQAEVYAAFDPTASLNTREMAIGLELPDWSSWLPILHPLDVWTPASDGASGLFETGYQGNAPLAALLAIESWLEANKNPNGAYGDWSHLSASQRNEIQGLFPSLGGQTAAFGGGGQGSRISSDPSNPYGVQLGAQALQALLSAATVAQADLSGCGPTGPCTSFNTDSFIERANLSLYRWLAVKQWESVESYGLQAQSQFHGEVDASGNWAGQGEARGWPYGWPSVFYAAPRILSAPTVTPEGKRENYFSWENRVTSFYRSNAWAELQVTVNPGWAGASNGAIDWPNDLGFIQALSDDLNAANAPSWIAATHLMRFFANLSKLSELANTDLAFDRPDPNNPSNFYANSGWQSKADLLFKVSPSTVLDNGTSQPSRFRVLDQVMPGLYLMFVNGMISNYDALYTGTTRSQYRVCDPTNLVLGGPEQYSGMRFCIDAARTPLPLDSNAQPYCPYPADNGFTTEQYSVWGALAARQLGADAALVQRWSDWNDRMWPN